MVNYLVGGWALPLWKMMEWKSVGMMTFPIYGKIKNVPNHQPENYDELPFSFIIVITVLIISVDDHEYSTECDSDKDLKKKKLDCFVWLYSCSM